MIVKMAEDLSTVVVMYGIISLTIISKNFLFFFFLNYFRSDVGNKELKLLISDIQKCTDISTGQKLGEYALYDFVQLGPQAFGVIVRIDFDCAHILEENGKVRQIKLQGNSTYFFFRAIGYSYWKGIRGKKDSKKSLGRDVNNITIGKGDSIEIVEGIHKVYISIKKKKIGNNLKKIIGNNNLKQKIS